MWTNLEAERAQREVAGLANAGLAPEMAREEWQTFEVDGRSVPCLVLTPREVRSDRDHVFVHGGGWVFGSPRQTVGVTRRIAHQAKRRVVSVGYRLAPEHPYPAGIDDVVGVLDQIGQQGRLAGVMGSSAGAQIGLAATMVQRDRGRPMPSAALMINGAFAMTTDSHSHRLHGTSTESFGSAYMRFYIEAYGVEAAEDRAYGDLTRADLSGLPPVWLSCGDIDPLLDDTLAVFANIRAAGGRPRLQVVPSRTHGFTNQWHSDPLADNALEMAVDWLEETVAG
jgi:acetyl esterase